MDAKPAIDATAAQVVPSAPPFVAFLWLEAMLEERMTVDGAVVEAVSRVRSTWFEHLDHLHAYLADHSIHCIDCPSGGDLHALAARLANDAPDQSRALAAIPQPSGPVIAVLGPGVGEVAVVAAPQPHAPPARPRHAPLPDHRWSAAVGAFWRLTGATGPHLTCLDDDDLAACLKTPGLDWAPAVTRLRQDIARHRGLAVFRVDREHWRQQHVTLDPDWVDLHGRKWTDRIRVPGRFLGAAGDDPAVVQHRLREVLGLAGRGRDARRLASATAAFGAILAFLGLPVLDDWPAPVDITWPRPERVADDRRLLVTAWSTWVGPRSTIRLKRGLGLPLNPLELLQEAFHGDRRAHAGQTWRATTLAREAGIAEATGRSMLLASGPRAFERAAQLAQAMGYEFRLVPRAPVTATKGEKSPALEALGVSGARP